MVMRVFAAGGTGVLGRRLAPQLAARGHQAHAGKPDLKHFDRWAVPTIRLRTEGTDHLLAAAERPACPMSWRRATPTGTESAKADG